ncbi:MAG: ABC transporter permease [Clostridiales bacterium]|nr:ABC transporter permease [Clostridiales bacterium]
MKNTDNEQLNNITETPVEVTPLEAQVVVNDAPVVMNDGDEIEGEQKVYYKEMSPAQMVARRFFRSHLSLIGLIMLVVLFVFAFLGPPVFKMFGYTWGEDDVDDSGTITRTGDWITDTVNGEEVSAYQYIDHKVTIVSYARPSGKHLLGTDDKGMDVFARLMYGGRVSLTLGFVVVILETLIGVILGGISGYFGGWVDQVIMRIVDILNCIPTLPLLLIASAVIQSWNVPAELQIYYLMIMLTLLGWSGVARMVRGQILYLREQEYIVACEVMGIPTWRRIFKHLVPNIMPQLIVSMTLGLGSIILYESTLSYLGLGVPMPKAAWGSMISSSTDPITMQYYPNLWIPAGLLIVIAVLGFNFVGDGLRDAMDPKARK